MAGLLARRGVQDAAELTAWFADPLDGLHDPALLPDADRLLDRLTLARTRGERVLVFGDFDADGLTGLTIMTLALRRFGVTVEPYVPEPPRRGPRPVARGDRGRRRRRGDGHRHGRLRHDQRAPRSPSRGTRGIDVIVTDHHRVPPELPAAVAIVNPHRADSTYPDARLAGSGVAFKVAQLLLRDEPGGPAAALALADLATIGSVADVAPVVGENRAIARLGLERLRTAPRPGHRGAPGACPRRAGGRGPRDRVVRPRPAPERGRPGRRGDGSGAAPAGRGCGRGGRPRRRAGGGQPGAPRPDEDRRRGGPGDRRGRPGCARRPWSTGRGASASSASWRLGWPRIAAARRSSGRNSATSSARRAGVTGRWTSAPPSSSAATSSPGSAGTPARPASSCRPTAGRRSATRFLDLAARGQSAGSTGPAGDRPRPAGARGRLRPVPRVRRPGAGRPRQPGPAGRRAGPDGDARPRRDRRPHPAHAASASATSSTASPSGGPTSPRSSTRATGSTSSPGWRAGPSAGTRRSSSRSATSP